MLAGMGVDPFIVADEVFWQEVDPARLRAFDAVTAYNVYDWPRAGNAGFAGDSTFLADVEGLFARWQKAAKKAGVVFVPNAMPGYNDRGVRPAENHYVIPRRLQPTSPATSLFERSVALAKRFVDPTVPIVTITSFNEWHEWTQVEPARRTSHAPLPDEACRAIFPTLGHAVVHILGPHAAVHVGQISVWRRVMGFPALAEQLVEELKRRHVDLTIRPEGTTPRRAPCARRGPRCAGANTV